MISREAAEVAHTSVQEVFPRHVDLVALAHPNERDPRWYVPLSSAAVRFRGSRIYPGFRARARVYRAVLRAWVTVGGARFTHRVLPRERTDWPLGDVLRADLPTLAMAAVWVSAGEDPTRLTLQLMNKRGRVLGYAKYADSPRGMNQLRNEAYLLERIPRGVGPRMLRFEPFGDGVVLLQERLPGVPIPPAPALDPSQRDVLEQLAARDGVEYPTEAHPFVQRLCRQPTTPRHTVRRAVEALRGVRWPVVWMHGDFTYMNMYHYRGKCLVFDWEYGTEQGFPYLDAANWLIWDARSIRGQEPAAAREAVVHALEPILPAARRGFARPIALLSALHILTAGFSHGRGDEYEPWLLAFADLPL